MLYQRRTFTCPAGPRRTSERSWDYSVLGREEFLAKYGESAVEYSEHTIKFHTNNVPGNLPANCGSWHELMQARTNADPIGK